MRRLRSLAQDEGGSTLPLAVFFLFLALAVILGVIGATSLYLERKRLFTVADGAALAGAEAFDLGAVGTDGGRLQARLDDASVRAAVEEFVATTPHRALDDLVIERAGTADGTSAEVDLSAWWRPPMLSILLPSGIRIEVHSTARSVFH